MPDSNPTSAPLSPTAAAKLAEIRRIEATYDVLTPALYRRMRDLFAGRVPPAPQPSTTELAAELARLREIERRQATKLHSCAEALQRARTVAGNDPITANKRRVAALELDFEWQDDTHNATLARIAEVEAALSQPVAAE